MTISWHLYRIMCILQMTAAAFFMFATLLDSFYGVTFSDIARLLLFLLMILLSIFAVNIINNNYPDTPVTGNQKKTFNRLYLLNFLFLAVLFGVVISEFRSIRLLLSLTGRSFTELPSGMQIRFIMYFLMLVFQFLILYGLYVLRKILYLNFMKKKFEFENS